MNNVTEYVESKRLAYREVVSDRGGELNLKTCPFCFDSNFHFYINKITGQWYCHASLCGESGGLFTLKKHLGDIIDVQSIADITAQTPTDKVSKLNQEELKNQVDQAHFALWQNRKALAYLRSRCFSPEAISYFKLGCSKEDGMYWVWYPQICKGRVLNIKKRTLPPAEKKFKRLLGGESVLFNEDILHDNHKEILITEGESDCIALWSAGFKNIIGVTVGAQGIKTDWIDKLDKISTIYFVYDSDLPGVEGAKRFAKRLGIERCYNVQLPAGFKDVNEYLMQRDRDSFISLLQEAKKFDVDLVKSLGTILQEEIANIQVGAGPDTGLELPWKRVTELTGKMQPGDLWILAAKPGIGKTTWSLNMMYYYAMNNVPSLMFELEMSAHRILPRIVSLHLRKENCNNVEDLIQAFDELKDKPFYFAYCHTRLDWQTLSDTIRMSVRRYGIKFLVFDNLHFLVRTTEQTKEVSIMIQNFKLLAVETGIPILVIARPRKMREGKKIMDSDDLKDSADLAADADYVVILHRERRKDMDEHNIGTKGIYDPLTKVIVDKARFSAGGDCHLQAVDGEARFDE